VVYLTTLTFWFFVSPNANLDLLKKFYTLNPSYADKTFLSVKGVHILAFTYLQLLDTIVT
jgi:hypothetical protein